MFESDDVIKKIAEDLRERYGDKYQIATQLVTASIKGESIGSRPDIVLYDSESEKLMIVEVKGSSPNTELPLGAVQVLKKVKDANLTLNPKMVLVSPSNVSGLVESQLLHEKIDVIKFNEKENTSQKISELWDKYLVEEKNNP